MPAAGIIAIGTELTSGAKLDTNSHGLSRWLAEIGIPVRYHTTVADDFAANVEVIRTVWLMRADVVLLTGGLGPTQDDLTRQAIAAALEVDLLLDEESLRHRAAVQQSWPPDEPKQSAAGDVPAREASRCCRTRLAPRRASGAMSCERATTLRLAAFPGVPSELHRMFKEHVEPWLTGETVIRRAQINCFGMGGIADGKSCW
ncbi:MAG: molybdopterin-binding protein [Planctomycetaceae bacterium]